MARNLAGFQMPPLMITRIGADRAGDKIRAEFERFGLPQAGLQCDPAASTGRVVVERSAGDYIDPAAALQAAGAGAAAIYFGMLAQRHATSRTALRGLLEARGALRYLDLTCAKARSASAACSSRCTRPTSSRSMRTNSRTCSAGTPTPATRPTTWTAPTCARPAPP